MAKSIAKIIPLEVEKTGEFTEFLHYTYHLCGLCGLTNKKLPLYYSSEYTFGSPAFYLTNYQKHVTTEIQHLQ